MSRYIAQRASGFSTSKVELELVDGGASGPLLRVSDDGETWPLRGAALGRFNAINSMSLGVVLHLRVGSRSVSIASTGTTLSTSAALTAAPIGRPELYVEPDVFKALVGACGLGASVDGSSVSVPLTRNRLGVMGVLPNVAPFVLGAVIMMLLGAALERTDLLRSKLGQGLFGLFAFALMFGLVALQFRRGTRRAGHLTLELGSSGICLRDASGAATPPQPLASVRALRTHFIYTSRLSSYHCPTLTLEWPGQAPISIGAMSLSMRWKDTREGPDATYVIAEHDLRAIAEALGQADAIAD